MKRFLLILGLMLCCAGIASAQSVVQTASNFCASATTCAVAFGSNNTVHGSIHVAFRTAIGRFVTITDSNGNTYPAVPDASTSPSSIGYLGMFSAQNINAGANTVTVSVSGAATQIIMGITEDSGLAQSGNYVDQINSFSGSGTSCSTGSVTTSNSGQIVYAVLSTNHAQDTGSYSVPGPWTAWQSNAGTGFGSSDRVIGEYQVNVGGTFNGSLSWTTSASCAGLIITYESTVTAGVAPTITSANNTEFLVGTAYNFQATATGSAPITFSETGSLPMGVTLNAAGLLSGTAGSGTGGTYPIIITAANGNAPNASQNFTLTVFQPASCPAAAPPATRPVRTDRAILSNASVPSMGGTTGAGTIVTDTTYLTSGIRTKRVTDSNNGGGANEKTEGEINCNDTMFYTSDENGNLHFFSFVPDPSMAITAITGPSSGADTLVVAQFSPIDPVTLYLLVYDGTDGHAKFASYNFTTLAYTILHDPIMDIPTLGAYGNNLGVTPDANCLSSNIDGIQDLRRYSYIWCAASAGGRGPGARWLDGTTGIISGAWGPTGTITSGVRWGGHNWALGASNDTFLTIGTCLSGSPCTNNADGLVWDISKSAATAIQFYSINGSDYPVTIPGHLAVDVNGLVADNSVINGAELDRTLRTVDSSQPYFNLANANRVDLIPVPRNPDTYNNDAHTAWPSVTGMELPFYDNIEYFGGQITSISRSGNIVSGVNTTTLFCVPGQDSLQIRNVTGGSTSFNGTFTPTSCANDGLNFTYTQTGANESGTVGATSYVIPIATHTWDDEVIAVAVDGSNTISRFAHTYGNAGQNPFALQVSIHMSSDGKYVLFHSDWGQTLGTSTISGSPITDVFLIEMPVSTVAPVPAAPVKKGILFAQ